MIKNHKNIFNDSKVKIRKIILKLINSLKNKSNWKLLYGYITNFRKIYFINSKKRNNKVNKLQIKKEK